MLVIEYVSPLASFLYKYVDYKPFKMYTFSEKKQVAPRCSHLLYLFSYLYILL